MRDSTVIWAGYTIIGDRDSSPEVWSGAIGDSLMKLLLFVQTYQMVKGFVFTVARTESEVRSRLDAHRQRSAKGEKLESLLARLAGGGLDSIDNADEPAGGPAPAAKDESTAPSHTSDSTTDGPDEPDGPGDSIEDFLAQLRESPE